MALAFATAQRATRAYINKNDAICDVRRALVGAACSEPDDLGLEFGGYPRIGRKLQEAVEASLELADRMEAA